MCLLGDWGLRIWDCELGILDLFCKKDTFFSDGWTAGLMIFDCGIGICFAKMTLDCSGERVKW